MQPLALKACVSGSFRKAMVEVAEAVYTLTDMGVHVLSPADPRIVGERGEFLFVASDKQRVVKLVQERHLEMITQSDFLWLCCPEGYVGASAALEMGFALAKEVPIFALESPRDITLREFTSVCSLKAAVAASAMPEARLRAQRRRLLQA